MPAGARERIRPVEAKDVPLNARGAAFNRPEDAIGAIHTGTADERDGDYFGPTVNRVAR